ncbi:SDR family NAD(P)-dependent oxidoreductase [Actinobacteria bacterium YIM 96077]|uniref:Short-chain dehydrogenase n=1 Tax=Phytoactinopolyspora halophila TaxID=1981511 RepID=A0A329QAX5_9ACTN|nr:SDR family NAD(P)-dependent oxidoreductase [Phytoactinopolyspora halophila]AYY13743.1 SDR family NAD(P)-dependent oxidoreductase [Actinobacteria bacterium YIM 96077]RAW09474.1 short-chain dehydrogenase [Phytoactinopolyspora halophila]
MRGSSRTIVVAGATSGLVRHTAVELARAGHRMVLIGRDPSRAADLARAVPRAHVVVEDLSTSEGVERAAAQVRSVVDRVDTLVNGAGVMLPRRITTDEDIEMNFAVHHLAPFSLTSALLAELQRGDGRVVNVNSEGHRAPLRGSGAVRLQFDDLQSERSYDPFLVYSRTKLANLLFTYELHRRHPELTVVALHPGMIRTDLGRNFPRVRVMLFTAMLPPARKGAEPVVRLAAGSDLVNGAYYDKFQPTSSSNASYDVEDARRLWEITERLRGPFGARRDVPE